MPLSRCKELRCDAYVNNAPTVAALTDYVCRVRAGNAPGFRCLLLTALRVLSDASAEVAPAERRSRDARSSTDVTDVQPEHGSVAFGSRESSVA